MLIETFISKQCGSTCTETQAVTEADGEAVTMFARLLKKLSMELMKTYGDCFQKLKNRYREATASRMSKDR